VMVYGWRRTVMVYGWRRTTVERH